MNIFVTHDSPTVCARALDNVRLNKMIIETAQMLCANAPEDLKHLAPYKVTHYNHPCTKWARESIANTAWLVRHFNALVEERLSRTNKGHLTATKMAEYLKALTSYLFKHIDKDILLYHSGPLCLTMLPKPNSFVYVGLDECKVFSSDGKHVNVFESYRKLMLRKWSSELSNASNYQRFSRIWKHAPVSIEFNKSDD